MSETDDKKTVGVPLPYDAYDVLTFKLISGRTMAIVVPLDMSSEDKAMATEALKIAHEAHAKDRTKL